MWGGPSHTERTSAAPEDAQSQLISPELPHTLWNILEDSKTSSLLRRRKERQILDVPTAAHYLSWN